MEQNKPLALLVEDNPMQARVAKGILESMGFEVHHTTTGEEAVEWFNKKHYSLVLMDIGLDGEISGDEATKVIRENEESGKHCPIFAVTAHVTAELEKQYAEAGIDIVFEKPIQRDAVVEAFEKFTS